MEVVLTIRECSRGWKIFLIVVDACLYMKVCYEKCRLESRYPQTYCRCLYKVSLSALHNTASAH